MLILHKLSSARARWRGTPGLERYAILLMAGWGWIAAVSVLLAWASTNNRYYGVWGAAFALHATLHALLILVGVAHALRLGRGWRWDLTLSGCFLCSAHTLYYIWYALNGRPSSIILAWVFLVPALMLREAYHQRAGGTAPHAAAA